MDLKELQQHWNRFGEEDPLWAILTDEQKKGGRWDPDEFFATGVADIDALMSRVGDTLAATQRLRALDFGCGAGRLTQALGRHFENVVGVDIAPSMIELARKHNRLGDRCTYVQNDGPGLPTFESGTFNLVYSILVLQHMRPNFARAYIREFGRLLAPGGVLVFQVPAATQLPPAPTAEPPSFKLRHPVAHGLLSRVGAVWAYRKLRKRDARGPSEAGSDFQPVMEMNCVSRKDVESDLRDSGLRLLRAESHPLPGFESYFYWAQRPMAVS